MTSGSTAPSSGLPTPSNKRYVGIGLSPTALKKPSDETMGEFVVGNTSCRRATDRENALENAGTDLESSVRIMVRRERRNITCCMCDHKVGARSGHTIRLPIRECGVATLMDGVGCRLTYTRTRKMPSWNNHYLRGTTSVSKNNAT